METYGDIHLTQEQVKHIIAPPQTQTQAHVTHLPSTLSYGNTNGSEFPAIKPKRMEKSMKIHHQITSNAFLYSLYTTDLCVCIGLFVTTDIVFMEQCNKLFSLWLFFRSMRVFLAFLWSFFFANDFSQTCGVNSCVFFFFFASAFAGRKSFSLQIFFQSISIHLQ